MNMQALMQQAQKLQRDISKKKDEINEMNFVGNSELVEVTFNGKKEMLSIKIKSDTSLDKEDLEVLEDMIIIASNDAIKKIDKEMNDKLGAYGNQLNGII